MLLHKSVLTFTAFALLFTLALAACPKIISRKEWGAEPPEGRVRMKEPVPYMAIHHTYLPGFCSTTDACKKAMKSMQNYHKNELRWGDIGYSYCIGGDGNIYEGRGWGVVGAHTLGWNNNAIGVCFIGDFRQKLPTQNMLTRLNELAECGVSEGHLTKTFNYFGHLQVSNTECPGKTLYEYLKKLPRWTPKPVK